MTLHNNLVQVFNTNWTNSTSWGNKSLLMKTVCKWCNSAWNLKTFSSPNQYNIQPVMLFYCIRWDPEQYDNSKFLDPGPLVIVPSRVIVLDATICFSILHYFATNPTWSNSQLGPATQTTHVQNIPPTGQWKCISYLCSDTLHKERKFNMDVCRCCRATDA